jgi:hypothetical protein
MLDGTNGSFSCDNVYVGKRFVRVAPDLPRRVHVVGACRTGNRELAEEIYKRVRQRAGSKKMLPHMGFIDSLVGGLHARCVLRRAANRKSVSYSSPSNKSASTPTTSSSDEAGSSKRAPRLTYVFLAQCGRFENVGEHA